MFTNKEKLLVQHLLQQKGVYVTSKELANLLSCSDRTIRTYIKNLTEKLSSLSGVTLQAKQGHGYQLSFEDEQSYKGFIKSLGNQDHLFTPVDTSDISDRHNYILNKLLFEQKELYFDDLAEELFVSRSTLSYDFKKIRQALSAYDLTIKSKANKGVYVSGSERDKRRFIMAYFFGSDFFKTMYSYVDDELIQGKINFETLTVIVLDECREAHLKLSDFVIQNLVVHIALTIRRLAEGFHISPLEDNLVSNYPVEHAVASNILQRVARSIRIDFPQEEVDYITLHLISKGQLGKMDQELDEATVIRQDLVQVLGEFAEAGCYQFQQDFQLMEGLTTHLVTLRLRMDNGIALDNPLTEDIIQNYRDMFDFSEKVLQTLHLFSEHKFSRDEIAYVALHFMAAKERYKEKNKYNILVICATGYGSAQMLRSRIENELGRYVHVVDVIGYYELTDDKLKGIDFIISSIDLSNLIFTIPVFVTSVFLKDEELKELKKEIEALTVSQDFLPVKENQEQLAFAELFDRYFSPDGFILGEGEDWQKEALTEALVKKLSDGEDDHFTDRMLTLIQQREQLSSVVFSETIAVPHPIKPLADQLKIGVAILPQGLFWEPDYPSIKLVFLPSLSVHDNQGLKELTKAIVDLTEQPLVQEQLVNCQSFDEFRDLFIKSRER